MSNITFTKFSHTATGWLTTYFARLLVLGLLIFTTLPPLYAADSTLYQSVVLTEDLQFNIPHLIYKSPTGDLPFWGKLRFVPTADGRLLWEVADYGNYTGEPPTDYSEVILTPDLQLQIPQLIYQTGGDNQLWWGNLKYVPNNEGKILFEADTYAQGFKDLYEDVNFIELITAKASGTVSTSGGTIKDGWGDFAVHVPEGAAEKDTAINITAGRNAVGDIAIIIQADSSLNAAEITLPNPEVLELNTPIQQQQWSRREALRSENNEYPVKYNWQRKHAYFVEHNDLDGDLFGVGNRLPEESQAGVEGEYPKINFAGKILLYFAINHTVASELNSVCLSYESACYKDKIPVLFIHGYLPSDNWVGGLGGGESTWKNFPKAIQSFDDGSGVSFVPFEFRWRTGARFEDVAADLGKAINQIVQATGKKVHIIAHSFGGVLTRTYLQGLANNYVRNRENVASVTTVGSPHSGIFDKEVTVKLDDDTDVFFPIGQDFQSQEIVYGTIAGDLQIDLCEQISCYEMGEDILFTDAQVKLFKLASQPGQISEKLASKNHSLPENLPVQVLIGLSTSRGFNSTIDEGDGLISYEGQRFAPRVGSLLSLFTKNTLWGGQVTEHLLGFSDDLGPGLSNPFEKGNLHYYGYRHSGAPVGPVEATPMVQVECASAIDCKHPAFEYAVNWIIAHLDSSTSATPQTFPVSLTVLDTDNNPVSEVEVSVKIDGVECPFKCSGKTDNNGSLTLPEVSFYTDSVYQVLVGGKPGKYRAVDTTFKTGSSLQEGDGDVGEITVPIIPSAPTGLNAEVGDGQITLSWNEPELTEVVSYNLYWKAAGGEEQFVPNVSVPYVHTGLINGITYWYRVTTVTTRGLESTFSGQIAGTPTPPASGNGQGSSAGLFKQVTVGYEHSCALKNDGSVVCWGHNNYGQALPPPGTFTQLSSGNNFTCGVQMDGGIACWGDIAAPPKVLLMTDIFTQVSVGDEHICALKSHGNVVCWGSDIYKQSSPLTDTFKQVSSGAEHTCALRMDDSIACWGSDDGGQAKPPETGTFTQVSSGLHHTCALRMDGSIACWGDEYRRGEVSPPTGVFTQIAGECAVKASGNIVCWGDASNASPPTDTLGTFIQVSIESPWRGYVTGKDHACALKTDGSIACWGNNYYGQASPPTGGFKQVTSGPFTICALKTDNSIACWGNNDKDSASPPAGTFTQISFGDEHGCAIKTDGGIECWGNDSDDEASPPVGIFTQVSSGEDHSCAVLTDSTITCWGSDYYGQAFYTPGFFKQVSAGKYYTCAVQTDGSIDCWGDDDYHQTRQPAGNNFKQVNSGKFYTCALQTDGKITCWGDNVGLKGVTSPPTNIFTQVSINTTNSVDICGLQKEDGNILCWSWGRFKDEDFTEGFAPEKDIFGGIFTQISNPCALTISGSIICWGGEYSRIIPSSTFSNNSIR
ncbi:MAG: hypothetical protein BWK78_05130 [Thiotrichaceae bacterium IS1]|nr:MAG: hypothetical protein BWK78_05130 [Thiotrichaceae bacterium IS1]